MKAEGIRVGDYFMVEPSGMTIKVAAIHNKKVGYHAVTNRLEWVRIGLLRPIPLSREIFERNGFEKVEDIGFSLYCKDENGFAMYHIYYHHHYYLDIDGYIRGIGTFEGVNIQYLHQLQQAMDLCRITREIKI